jgi:hypothetical protein
MTFGGPDNVRPFFFLTPSSRTYAGRYSDECHDRPEIFAMPPLEILA